MSSIVSLSPYLNFNGTANEAIAFYERVLGSKAENVTRFGSVPGMEGNAAIANRVMHARIPVAGAHLMISDTMPDAPAHVAGNVSVSLAFDDPAALKKTFDAMAEGGKILHAVHEAFWGGTFGMLVDAFGIEWLFATEATKGGAS